MSDGQTSKPTKAAKPTKADESKPSGTSAIFQGSGIRFPDPQIDRPRQQVAKQPPAKEKDPHKSKDVHIGSAHIIKTIARTSAENRTTRLVELARTDNDVKWLLSEYQKLSATKK